MDVKILGICGSPVKGGNTEGFLDVALRGAAEMGPEVKTELVTLAGRVVKGCNHCHWCESKQKENSLPCAIQDEVGDIWPKMMEADGLLLATPVYIGRMSGIMSCFLDRVRSLGHGNYYSGVMVNKPAGALSVLWFRDAGGETALMTLLWTILTMGMVPATGFGSRKYGAVGLSSPGGTGNFEEAEKGNKLMVLKDKHGCQSARIVGKRVVFLARALKPARLAAQEIARSAFPNTPNRWPAIYLSGTVK